MCRAPALRLALVALLFATSCRKGIPPASLTISVPYQIETLDPHAKDRLGNVAIASHFYDALVTMDPEMALRPRLAVGWETPDPLTWVLHLRDGVRFHGGEAFGAGDVVFTFDRLRRDPALECGVYAAQITSVRALDERTVEMKTARPVAFLLNKLATVFIVPRGSGANLSAAENGTGPYRLDSLAPGQIRMTADPAHWGAPPEAKAVTFLLARGSAEAAADLARGRAELAQCSSREALHVLEGRSDLTIARRTELYTKMLGFDLVHETTKYVRGPRNPFRNRAVREAVSLAIDRHALAEALSTRAVPAGQLVPPTIFGYDPSHGAPPHDPARARRLLAEAGFPDGFDVTLHTRQRFAEGARQVAAQLAPAGIRATVAELPDAQFFELGNRHELSFFLLSFGCASGDASDLLDAALHTVDRVRRFGTSNFAGFSDRSLDEAIEKSAQLPDSGARLSALRAIVSRVADEQILVPLYVDEAVFATARPYVFRPRADSFLLASEVARRADLDRPE